MTTLSISKAWDETKDVLAHDGRLIGAVALAAVLLPQAIAGVIAPPANLSGEQPPSWMPVLALIVGVAGLVGQIAVMRLALGPATSVGEAITHGLKRLLPAFAAILLFAIPLALVLSIVLAAIAGPAKLEVMMAGGTTDPNIGRAILIFALVALAVSVRFQMILPVATAEDGGPIHIFRRSWELTAGHYLRLLGFLLLVGLVAIVVLLTAQIVGGILAQSVFGDAKPLSISALIVALITGVVQTALVVIVATMTARIYAQLAGRRTGANSGT
jgi:hypothetical protein